MATSGTIGTTVVQTDSILLHALLRCGLRSTSLTPEIVSLAFDDLFFLLLNLASRGLNLWCIDKQIIGLFPNQATYVLPVGTIDVLNVVYSQPTVQASVTSYPSGTQALGTLTSSTMIVRFGFMPTATFDDSLTFSINTGAGYVVDQTLPSQEWTAGAWYWYDIKVPKTASLYRLQSTTQAFTLSNFVLSSNTYDQKISPFNRDTYTVQPDKNRAGTPSTNYYFEKLVNPQITLWPITQNTTDQITVWRHRQIQDIGTLTQEIELPNRWLEPIIWQLAYSLSYEIPEVDPARRAEIATNRQNFLADGEHNESDHLPMYIVPRIRGYTR